MDEYDALLSPLWWASVLLVGILINAGCSWLVRRRARNGPERPSGDQEAPRHLRLGPWVLGLTVLANIAMFVTLAAANLRVPRLAGPVGICFLLCCLVSLTLAVALHGASRSTKDE